MMGIHYSLTPYMGHSMRCFKFLPVFLCIITLCTLSGLVHAQEDAMPHRVLKPLNMAGWHEVYWSGLHIGDLVTYIEETTDGHYRIRTAIESRGLAGVISQFFSRNETQGRFNAKDNHYWPGQFRTYFHSRKTPRAITLFYDNKGHIPERLYNPLENRDKRPDVAAELRAGTLDPLTLILQARHQLHRALMQGNKAFSINMYDGRRLSRFDFTLQGSTIITRQGEKSRTQHVTIQRTPIAGFTGRELERMEEGEEPVIDAWFSDDAELIPIEIRASALLGTAVGRLKKLCSNYQDCLKKADIDARKVQW